MEDSAIDTKTGTLDVEGIKPILNIGPMNREVKEGTDIQAVCVVEGYPLPTFSWYKDPISPEVGSHRIQYDQRIFLDKV